MGGSAPQGLITQHSKGRFGHHQCANQLTDVSLGLKGHFSPTNVASYQPTLSRISQDYLRNIRQFPSTGRAHLSDRRPVDEHHNRYIQKTFQFFFPFLSFYSKKYKKKIPQLIYFYARDGDRTHGHSVKSRALYH